MRKRTLVRDLALLMSAGALGWWAHGANTAVRAAGTSSDTAREGAGIGFQFGGAGLEGSLTLYNPDNKTLYVYPAGAGNSRINCVYSIHVDRPGGPLERQNCGIGSAFSR